ncbi:MAG: 50S ribosomal protein L10 [Clostridia bacterium]|nr:50S ribosomal protein L10 [Clostridia bacterium]
MPKNRELKEQVVRDLKEKINNASCVIFTDYKGLTVEEDTDLRKRFRESNVEYRVVKNTLAKLAIQDSDYDDVVNALEGPTSIAIGLDDPVAPAKVLNKFINEYKKMQVKVGIVDGKIVGVDDIKALADLPPREVLIAKALAGMNSPITGLVNVMQGTIRNLVYALNAVKDKKQ